MRKKNLLSLALASALLLTLAACGGESTKRAAARSPGVRRPPAPRLSSLRWWS